MQLPSHRCRRTTAVAQLPSHSTTWTAIYLKKYIDIF